jgi:hypothetical protein
MDRPVYARERREGYPIQVQVITSEKNAHYLHEWRRYMMNPDAEVVVASSNRFGPVATNSIATEVALFAFYNRDEQDQITEQDRIQTYMQVRKDQNNEWLDTRRQISVIMPDIDQAKISSRAAELGTNASLYTEFLLNTTLEGLINFYTGKPMDYIGPDIQNEFAEYRNYLESLKAST